MSRLSLKCVSHIAFRRPGKDLFWQNVSTAELRKTDLFDARFSYITLVISTDVSSSSRNNTKDCLREKERKIGGAVPSGYVQ